MMTNLTEFTKNTQNHVSSLQDYTQINNKRQKHGEDNFEEDEDMNEVDALHENRDTLADIMLGQ
eukprot:10709329-Ditylum_brightwellii.AAC.1